MTVTQPSPDWNLVTLKWAGTYIDGSPATGWVELSYNSPGPMLDDDPTTPLSIFTKGIRIPISTTQVLIDGQMKTVGYVSVAVPASNDPDIVGGGGTYQFTELLNEGGGRVGVNFVADKDAPGGLIWINRLPSVDSTPADPVSVVYWADFNALSNRVEALENTDPGGGGPAVDDLDDVLDSATRKAMTTDERTQLAGLPDALNGKVPTSRTVAGKALTADVTLAKGDVGLGAVDNTSDANKPVSTATATALAGKADLVGGVVPSAQLPSYVDDVLEFANLAAFPTTGESGKIYTALDTSRIYRWSGSAYVVISDTIALGETSATAYRGDRGKTAYDHSQITAGNPHGTTAGDVGAEPARTPVTQAEAETGTATTVRGWTAQRVFQAIAAWVAANAAAIRTSIGYSVLPYPWSASIATISTTATARVPTAQTLTEARMRVSGAPVGSALTVVVQRSTGGGAFTDLVTLSIAAGSTTEAVQAVTTSLTAGDLLRLNVTSVGSTTAATGVAVEVYPA